MYGLLFRTFIRERLSLRRLFGQKIARSKIQSILMVAVLVYAFGVTAFSNTILQFEIAKSLVILDNLSQMLYQVVGGLSTLGFLFGFFQAQGYLFQYKDFDLLGPLPIPQRVIVAAKLTMMLVFVYLFALIMVMPTYGVWWYVSEASFIQFLLFLPMAMVAPIPLMLLGSFISFVLRKLTQRWVNANVLQTIFSVLFVLSFAFFNYFSNEILPSSWIDFLADVDIVASWFVNGIASTNLVLVLLYLFLHGLVFFGFVFVMSGSLLKINQQRTNLVYKRRDKIPNQVQSVMKHLVIKEWQRFIGTSVYFLNTGFGILVLSLLAIISLFIPSIILELNQMLLAMQINPIWLIFAFIGFALSTVYTPAVSLSLEGKNINLLKSLPIKPWTIIQSKIYFNLCITLPSVFLSSLVGGILFQIEVITFALFIVFIFLFTVLLSIFFMYLNLWFPRFDFHQEVEVVKQSLAALVAVFGGFSILGACLWLVFDPFQYFDIHIQLFMLMLIEFVLIVIGGWLLRKNAQKHFQTFSV